MTRIVSAFRGSGLMARVLRSASWLIIGYGGSQAMRLAANLILTRLLFPEAFGLMALVTVVTVGLNLFSDVGIGPAIAQSKRGDEPDFLDTAWSIQVLRGIGLFGVACLLAVPVAQFYGEPSLTGYLPIAALSLLIAGFNPTRIETAHRHLLVGRLTVLDLISQACGIVFMVALAQASGSVLALVLGGVAQAAAKLILTQLFLPGPANRFQWERTSVAELTHFGKWIFLSTALTFLLSQGDRAILGRYLSLEMLGLYNIGFFLGSFPSLLGHAVNGRIMIPVYRDTAAHEDPSQRRKQRFLRSGLTFGIGGMLLVMALAGPALVEFLYDTRYLGAGPIVTLVALTLMPQVIGMTYDPAALAAGDSRSYFILTLARAGLQVGAILVGMAFFGLTGAILGIGAATILSYPVLVWLAVRHQVWDPLHDSFAAVVLALLSLAVLWAHWDRIAALSAL